MNLNKNDFKICVVGLGYVGLPLAERLSLKEFDVVGFDINETSVQELSNIVDRTDDIEAFKKHLNKVGVYCSDWGETAVAGWKQIFFYDPDGNVIEGHEVENN